MPSSYYSCDAYPGSLKKRYGTPLRLDELLRSDSHRRAYLAGRAARLNELQQEASVLTYNPAEWIASRTHEHNDHTHPQENPDMDEAAINNDALLPYERPVPKRDLAYWLAELEHINLEGSTIGGEETPAKGTPVNPVRLRPDMSHLDDPFVSPVRLQTISKAPDQHQLFTLQPDRPRSKRSHHRGRSLMDTPAFPEIGQISIPQLHVKRRESVPNFSRPLTPECQTTPKHASTSKKRTIRTRHSDQAIRYERVNGIYLDTTPRSAKERREGLSIPEIEARDLVRLDEWLMENAPAEGVYANIEAHPARPPPPIGGKENSVRAISPQPPSAGKNHTFVSRYSWNVEKIPNVAADLATISISTSHRLPEDGTPTRASNQIEPARELLTEIIRGILGPPGHPCPPDGERSSSESDSSRHRYGRRDYPPDYSTVQPRERRGHFREDFSPSRYVVDASIPAGEHGCSTHGSYRKRIGFFGKEAIKLVTLRQSRLCGAGTM